MYARKAVIIGIIAGIAVFFLLLTAAAATRFSRATSRVQPTIMMIYPEFANTPFPETALEQPAIPANATVNGQMAGQQVFSMGQWVQVTGTEGVGLRLRTEAGIESAIILVALDNELFEVRGGPVDLEAGRWWFLVNPYDASQAGWADDRYLREVEN
ncbi:MAG: SH3 domain-containing protein [Anaerolineales bacterium]|nr:SH3 domain-containing protein [Anaerolineales bacterium]